MKNSLLYLPYKIILNLVFLLISTSVFSQLQTQNTDKSDFWKNVRFGGGLGIGIGNNFTNITVAPSAIYDVDKTFSIGLGLQGSYVKQKEIYNSYIYGASLITLVNPIHEIQLSAELEQLRVNLTNETFTPNTKDNFWNTAMFLGAGYRAQNVTIGIRYNVLYKDSDMVYTQAWMPFVRVYF
jgi:hypothetical protein